MMTPAQQASVTQAHNALPESCRSAPASEEALVAFEAEHGAIPADYRWYLANCGGGVIGCDWIDSIKELWETHRRVKEARAKGFYLRLGDYFPVGWDGWGCTYGFDLKTGRIMLEDHELGVWPARMKMCFVPWHGGVS
jgi:hypothetical protein